jgi:hypothetical protein
MARNGESLRFRKAVPSGPSGGLIATTRKPDEKNQRITILCENSSNSFGGIKNNPGTCKDAVSEYKLSQGGK